MRKKMTNKASNRINVSKDGAFKIISISGKIEKWKETLLITWLLAWTICGGYVITELFGSYTKEEKLVLLVYLVLWGYFEVKIIYVFLWRKWGSELIKVDGEAIWIKNEIKSYGKVEKYFRENISEIQVIESTPLITKIYADSFWNISAKYIQFQYLGKTIRLGIQLTNSEATKLFKLLKS